MIWQYCLCLLPFFIEPPNQPFRFNVILLKTKVIQCCLKPCRAKIVTSAVIWYGMVWYDGNVNKQNGSSALLRFHTREREWAFCEDVEFFFHRFFLHSLARSSLLIKKHQKNASMFARCVHILCRFIRKVNITNKQPHTTKAQRHKTMLYAPNVQICCSNFVPFQSSFFLIFLMARYQDRIR